jgi:hypothetical protein
VPFHQFLSLSLSNSLAQTIALAETFSIARDRRRELKNKFCENHKRRYFFKEKLKEEEEEEKQNASQILIREIQKCGLRCGNEL